MELTALVKELGAAGLEMFWFPVALWTVASLIAAGIMKYSENSYPIFQYHGRIALLIALPAGIVASMANRWISTSAETAGQFATRFIVIQSPITITSSQSVTETSYWGDPAVLSGILIAVLGLTAMLLLVKLAMDFLSLSRFSKELTVIPLDKVNEISEGNLHTASRLPFQSRIAFSTAVDVPFTFGWRKPIIVIPARLQLANTEKLNMIVRHELMHVRHRDFMLNSMLMVIKALFWFHPVVHKLFRDAKEYREISCDTEVLNDKDISKKSYARLLFELVPGETLQNGVAVNMAVDSSTLKKRIQIMSTQKHSPSLIKTSFFTMMTSMLLLTGIMACTDIQDGGITKQEIENTQRNLATASPDNRPLYIINGEELDASESGNILSRLKPEYIQSIEVLKGQKAIDQYGQKGMNGVLLIELIDKQKAFSDLLPAPPQKAVKPEATDEDHYVVVEQMPKLKGGLEGLASKVKYPKPARQAGIEGRVIVQFIVNEEGKVENPKVIRGIGGGADEEALRVVRQAEFEAGKQQGEAVRVQYSLPIIFSLDRKRAG